MKRQVIPSISFFFVCITFLSLNGCSKNKISDHLNFSCNTNYKFTNLKACLEPNENYKINLPNNWKREFFVSKNESRLYYADTTKELHKTYISDVGLYFKKTNINQDFLVGRISELEQDYGMQVIDSRNIVFQKKKGLLIYVSKETPAINSIELYLQNKNNSYFLIKIDVYGNENQHERLCEALSIIEISEFY